MGLPFVFFSLWEVRRIACAADGDLLRPDTLVFRILEAARLPAVCRAS